MSGSLTQALLDAQANKPQMPLASMVPVAQALTTNQDPMTSQAPSLADAMSYNAPIVKEAITGAITAAQNPQTWIDAAHQWGNAMIAGTSAPGEGFVAYHGSPHSFDKFDLGKIGTGEGAQAFGHGLYFADNEGVARSYRDKLSPPVDNTTLLADNIPLDPNSVEHQVANVISTAGYPAAEANIRAWMRLGRYGPEYGSALDALKNKTISKPASPGSMYEVQINANPEHFLDWDKPIAGQPSVVERLNSGDRGMRALASNPDMMGSDLYHALARTSPEPAAASLTLQRAGIPGIRYLDGGSRANGTGTSNTVVFDPSTIEILRKYGALGTLAGGAGAGAYGVQQQQQ